MLENNDLPHDTTTAARRHLRLLRAKTVIPELLGRLLRDCLIGVSPFLSHVAHGKPVYVCATLDITEVFRQFVSFEAYATHLMELMLILYKFHSPSVP